LAIITVGSEEIFDVREYGNLGDTGITTLSEMAAVFCHAPLINALLTA
jgi:hypothetical protein